MVQARKISNWTDHSNEARSHLGELAEESTSQPLLESAAGFIKHPNRHSSYTDTFFLYRFTLESIRRENFK